MMKTIFKKSVLVALVGLVATGCQKLDRPGMGDYPQDANPPGGPLSFYVSFDGTTSDPLYNAVDSIRANFPSSNTLSAIDGVRGKGITGKNQWFVKYAKPNDFASLAKSFAVSVWFKKNGQTQNNTMAAGNAGNGPEYIFSFPSSNGHWSGTNMMLFLEGNNTACAIKMVCVDKNMADTWFTWEGGGSIAGILDDKWHHMVLTYNAATSGCTLYLDGIANSNIKTWGTHGNLNIDGSKISEVRIGGGPKNDWGSSDWLSSTWKGGGIDQFRLYNVALSEAEVKALYNGKQ
jgi:hypothetical protein